MGELIGVWKTHKTSHRSIPGEQWRRNECFFFSPLSHPTLLYLSTTFVVCHVSEQQKNSNTNKNRGLGTTSRAQTIPLQTFEGGLNRDLQGPGGGRARLAEVPCHLLSPLSPVRGAAFIHSLPSTHVLCKSCFGCRVKIRIPRWPQRILNGHPRWFAHRSLKAEGRECF